MATHEPPRTAGEPGGKLRAKQREQTLALLRASRKLPGCSPLSPASVIRPGTATESISQQLRDVGHTAAWSPDTGLHVSPVLSTLERQAVEQRLSLRPSLADAAQQELGLTSGLLNSLNREATAGLRAKTGSSLTWSAKPGKRTNNGRGGGPRMPGDLIAASAPVSLGATAARPCTAPAGSLAAQPAASPAKPAAGSAAPGGATSAAPAAALTAAAALQQQAVQTAAGGSSLTEPRAGTTAPAAAATSAAATTEDSVGCSTADEPAAAAAAAVDRTPAEAAAVDGQEGKPLPETASSCTAAQPRYMQATLSSAAAAAHGAAASSSNGSKPGVVASAAQCPAVAKIAAAAVEVMVAAKHAAAAGAVAEGGGATVNQWRPSTSSSSRQQVPGSRPGTSSNTQRLVLDALPSRPATATGHVGCTSPAAAAPSSWEASLRQGHPSGSSSSSSSSGQQLPGRPSTAPGSMTIEAAIDAMAAGTLTRSAVQRLAQHLKPGRGEALLVFEHMDRDKNGKVTLAEFEEAAVSIGFQDDQARRMFSNLDLRGREYLEPLDWGAAGALHLVEQFSLMYLQKHMGFPNPTSTPEQVQQYLANHSSHTATSLAAAITAIRANAVRCGARAATKGNPVYEAFRYMDMDNSGDLHRDELKDAFAALGVHVTEPVLDQIMEKFDLEDTDRVKYWEFLRTMFPSVGK